MPVFHTKTIESILEPVAQQVSRLVILHEEAEDGNAMPDLNRPVLVVKQAVDHLVQIGYETVNTSDDVVLKQDMPPALDRVERSAALLLEASDLLCSDPYSGPGRKKLIEGSRGILQGTSSLLLAFDESEVRRIIAQCKGVLEYLAIAEVLECMDDLVTFVKNIGPGLTRMTKQVDDREKELTHQTHRAILQRCLEQIKVLTPVLISSIKVYINLLKDSSPSTEEAKDNRNFTCRAVCAEIQEIIRVLQLTSVDDDNELDDAEYIRKVLNDMASRLPQAHDWLVDPQAMPGGIGERALLTLLDSAYKAADRCADPKEREAVKKIVGDIKSMLDALNELKANGKGDSAQALALAKGIEERVSDLHKVFAIAISSSERAGVAPAAQQMRLNAAQQWCRNPGAHDKGLGEKEARTLINDSRKLAATLPAGKEKEELLKMCYETEMCVDQLSDLCHKGMGTSPQAAAIARVLSEKLNSLKDTVNGVIARKMVDDFMDPAAPLKQLTQAALAPIDDPNREANFSERAARFEQHSAKVANTAKLVASCGSVPNKKIIEDINGYARQINKLAPQVVRAALVVLANPNQESAREHFELIKNQWSDNMEKMRVLVDDASDRFAFMKASEIAILEDTAHIEEAIITADQVGIVDSAASIARRANRVLQVAQQEADNSEDAIFVHNVNLTTDNLKATIPAMVKNAKTLTVDPRNSQHGNAWRKENDSLIDAVRDVREKIFPQAPAYSAPLSPIPVPPDMTRLTLDIAPPRPPLPDGIDAPPRPPLPIDQDAEMERVFRSQPLESQPIMVAAHNLHQEVKHWESGDNELVQAAKQMALLMAKLSQLVRGDGGSKRDLIDTAKAIADASAVVARLAQGLAAECTDKRMRTNLLQVCERIPTIATQLKILSTVKATMLGAQGSEEDQEATDMLVGNAQNLMQSVRDTVRAAESASIKIRVESGYSIRWVRRRPWYTN